MEDGWTVATTIGASGEGTGAPRRPVTLNAGPRRDRAAVAPRQTMREGGVRGHERGGRSLARRAVRATSSRHHLTLARAAVGRQPAFALAPAPAPAPALARPAR